MKRTLTLLAALALSLPAAALACDGHRSETTADAALSIPAEARLVTLRIEDATCGGCVLPIREKLTAMGGVLKVEGSEADYKDVLVTIKGADLSDAQLIAAVKEAGYTAIIKPVAPTTDKTNS